MDAIGQRFKRLVWFLPAQYFQRFAAIFGMYMATGFIYLVARGAGVLEAFALTTAFGVILTALSIAVVNAGRSLKRFEEDGITGKPRLWRALFSPLKSSSDSGDSGPPNSGGVSSSGVEDEEFKKRMLANQRDSRKRAWMKMRDKVLNMGFVVAVYSLIFWFAAEGMYGFFSALFGTAGGVSVGGIGGGTVSFSTPKELFIFDWRVLVVMWWLAIVLMPRWTIILMLVGMSVMRVMLGVFGAMSSQWIMNIGMLPLFYGVMMIFLFGSIIYPFIKQIKDYRPGDATWGTPKGSMRGQPEVRAIVETELAKLGDYISGKSKRRPTRGVVFEGPPGTGKTLFAREIATEYSLPIVIADGASLSGAPFVNLIVEYYLKPRVHKLAEEHGGVLLFIDEAEVLFQLRQGMQGGGSSPSGEIRDVWDLLDYDSVGCTSTCGMVYDSAQARERFWQLKSPLSLGKEPKMYTHPFFMPMGMGGTGGAIFPFLTWLDGVGSPPAMETLKRKVANNILDGFLLVPPFNPITKRLWRFGPAKPKNPLVLFIIATNRAFMLDPAIRRPGRMGVSARFKTPDYESRQDIIDLYFGKAIEAGLLRPELLGEETVSEFARATSGMSPAEIEAVINMSYDVRSSHVKNMERINALIGSGVSVDDLLENDRKYWLRHEDELESEEWRDERGDMRSLLEARNALIYGKADPGLTTAEHREVTAKHEYYGHELILKATLGMKRNYNVMRPSVISVMPPGNSF